MTRDHLQRADDRHLAREVEEVRELRAQHRAALRTTATGSADQGRGQGEPHDPRAALNREPDAYFPSTIRSKKGTTP